MASFLSRVVCGAPVVLAIGACGTESSHDDPLAGGVGGDVGLGNAAAGGLQDSGGSFAGAGVPGTVGGAGISASNAGGAPPIGGASSAGGVSAGGAAEVGGATVGDGGEPGATPDGGRDAAGHIVSECQGFPLEGLTHSPGGSTLPNVCAPFDALMNNPFAVRCVDAISDFESGFPGDELCILPPPEDQGIQVGVHPQGNDYWNQIWAGDYSGYDNPGEEWVLQPGEERVQNYVGHASNPESHAYYRTYFRMRTGSHHNIITMHRGGSADGWQASVGEALPGLFDSTAGQLAGVLGGQQRPDDGTPATFEKPPEDEGLYLQWPESPDILFNMHHFNATLEPLLREGWVNIWWEPDAERLASWYMGLGLDQLVMSIPPGETMDFHYSWTVRDQPVRLLRVFGHRHFWTTNFSAWIERAGSDTPEMIYQSFDWEDMPTFRYDSVVTNLAPDADLKRDGATSGITMLNPGDEFHFNCHIEYTEERAADHPSAPSPAAHGSLTFSNQAFNGEMCINFGNVSGGRLGSPTRDSGPVPAEATK